jgi:hypothetical protein
MQNSYVKVQHILLKLNVSVFHNYIKLMRPLMSKMEHVWCTLCTKYPLLRISLLILWIKADWKTERRKSNQRLPIERQWMEIRTGGGWGVTWHGHPRCKTFWIEKCFFSSVCHFVFQKVLFHFPEYRAPFLIIYI